MNKKAVAVSLGALALVVTRQYLRQSRNKYILQQTKLAQDMKYDVAKKQLEEASVIAGFQADIEWFDGIGCVAEEYFAANPVPFPASMEFQLGLMRKIFRTYYTEVATRTLLMDALRIKHEHGPELERVMAFAKAELDGRLERLHETLMSVFTEAQLHEVLPVA